MTTRTQVGALLTVGVAAFSAWAVGGAVGAGILGGGLAGCAMALLGVGLQARTARQAPARVLQAMGVAFLVKFLAMVAVGVSLLVLDRDASAVDWRAALIAYSAAALTVSFLGSLDVARTLRQQRAL